MRRKVLIIYALFAFAILPTLVGNVAAQTNIVEMSSVLQSRASIVRVYTKNLSLVYNQDGQGNYTFNLIDVLTGFCYTMYLPGMTVNDVEIVNDTAYFCGNIGYNVVAGWFDIQSLFFSGGSMSCFIIPATLSCSLNPSTCTEGILSLDKLEIIKYANGLNHMVMVGKAKCTMSETPNTCIAEIYHDGFDFKFAYQVEHPGVFGYDDIAVTNEKVVVVGHKIDSEGEYLTAFGIPANNNNMFSLIESNNCLSNFNCTYSAGGPSYTPHHDSEILIDAIPGTSYFATVCQAEGHINLKAPAEGTYFNLYANDSTIIHRCKIDDYHSLSYTEFKYNPKTNSFFLLMKDTTTNMNNGYYEFVLNNALSSVTSVTFHQEQGFNTYVSLDRYSMQYAKPRCVLTGYDNANNLYIWHHEAIAQMVCSRTYDVSFWSLPVSLTWFCYTYPYNDITLDEYTYTDIIHTSELHIMCNE